MILILRESFLVADEDVIELPAEVWFPFYCLLNHLVELSDVFVHQCSCVVIEGLL